MEATSNVGVEAGADSVLVLGEGVWHGAVDTARIIHAAAMRDDLLRNAGSLAERWVMRVPAFC